MTKEHLKMADVFRNEMRVVGDSSNMIADDVGILIGCYSGDKMAEYVLHAINSHDELVAEVERLREFERDAMRYHWLMQNTKFGIGRNGKDWDLQVDGSAPDSISEVGEWIDNRMDGMM